MPRLNILNVIIIFLVSYIMAKILLISINLAVIIFVGLVLIFIMFLFLKNKDSLLYLVILFPLFPVHMGYDLGYFLPVLKVHRVLMGFMLIFWLARSKTVKESIKDFPLTKPFLLMLVAMFFSAILSKHPYSTLFNIGTFFFEFYLFAVMFFDLIREKDTVNKLFFGIVSVSSIIAIMGIFEFYTGFRVYSMIQPFRKEFEWAAFNTQYRGEYLRVKGPFEHSITFGIFLAFNAALSLFQVTIEMKKIKKTLLFVFYFLLAFTVLLTATRSALLYLVISSLFILIVKNKKALVMNMFLVILFILMLPSVSQKILSNSLFLAKSSIFFNKVGSTEMVGSALARVAMIKDVLPLIRENPILGYGSRHYSKYPLDNFYIIQILYFGFLSFIFFVWIMVKTILISITLIRQHESFVACLGLTSIGIIIATYSVWLVISLTSYFYLFWFLIAIICRVYSDIRKQKLDNWG